jgi:phosphonoacetaldehyde hydrolase
MGVFVEVFSEFGVAISVEEARIPMGMAKRAHIAAILALPRVANAWQAARGGPPSEADIDALYEVFVPRNRAVAARFADVIPGVADTVKECRALGLKIGSTTGYTRDIMAEILPVAASQGFKPDSLVCTGDTSEGRPTPLMMYKTFLDLDVHPAWSVVKVDDTEVGIAEGLNAGCWTVGVALTGNLLGLTVEETKSLSAADLAERRQRATQRLVAAGAHYTIDSVADLVPVLHAIEERAVRGERP